IYTSSLIALALILFLIPVVVLAAAKLLLFRIAGQEGSRS
ncbi:MAG TPA: phosphate ABC transporter permease subunit PstC, partial [Desulfobacteraceae bacterium]|nr:phosphate ABC transporter permease subunit PstC [Desulfobacteraceae bacterium]